MTDNPKSVPQGDEFPEVAARPALFQVYAAGEITVVGFSGNEIPNDFWIGAYKEDLSRIVREHNCKELAIDLGGVTTVPSGMLGLLTSLNDLGVTISLYNPSPELRGILELTNLNARIDIRELDIDENPDPADPEHSIPGDSSQE